jgi:hypothetical protein
MQINITSDIKRTRRQIKGFESQLPFAVMRTLNELGFKIQKEQQRQVSRKLDNPTPFTKRGFRVEKAKMSNLQTLIYIPPIQDEYMKYQIEGGTRNFRGKGGAAIPGKGLKVNAYGNIPGKRKGLLKRKSDFIIPGRGVFRTVGKVTKKVIAFVKKITYKNKFPFYQIGGGIVSNLGAQILKANVEKAISTAKFKG